MARVSYRTRFYELALENNGCVTTDLAKQNGIPAVELRKLLQRGAIERVGHGVYRSPFFPPTPQSEAQEALELVGEESFLYGQSVLTLLELGSVASRKTQVATAKRVRRDLPGYIKIVEVTKADLTPIQRYLGVRSQPVCDALKGAKADMRAELLSEAAGEALARGFISQEEFDDIVIS
jgi:predicted transcriptional regulator of viral defense system